MQWLTLTALTVLTALLYHWHDLIDFTILSFGLERSSALIIPDLQPIECEILDHPHEILPRNWRRGAFMQIYVRGYKDTDGDGIGDLQGVTESLDYLHDLGITGLWLMPITGS